MSPSIRTMGFFMSEINFCNTKEQLNHLGEVVTGKVDGSPTGADIDNSTLPYTGQVRKTLPALEGEYEQSIINKEAEADAVIDEYRLTNKGPYSAGITLESKFEYITYNGESYFAISPPYTTTATAPDADGNLFAGGYLTKQQIPLYTDVLYKNSAGKSAVESMIEEIALNPVMYAIGTIIKTGGTTWEYIDSTAPITSGNFRAFNVLNVRDFGAIPDQRLPDGSENPTPTDNTSAIQDAVDAAGSGGCIFFPSGFYGVLSHIEERSNGGRRWLRGESRKNTRIVALDGFTSIARGYMFWFGNSNGHGSYALRMSDLYIDARQLAVGCVFAGENGQGKMWDCDLRNFQEVGFRTSGATDTKVDNCEISSGNNNQTWGIVATCISASAPQDPSGYSFSYSLGASPSNEFKVSNCWFTGCATTVWANGDGVLIEGCTAQSCGKDKSRDDLFIVERQPFDADDITLNFPLIGPVIRTNWVEGGESKYSIRVSDYIGAKVYANTIFGSSNFNAANREGGILIEAGYAVVRDNTIYYSWTGPLNDGRLANASIYITSAAASTSHVYDNILFLTQRNNQLYTEGKANPTADRSGIPLTQAVISWTGLLDPVLDFSSGFVEEVLPIGAGVVQLNLNVNLPDTNIPVQVTCESQNYVGHFSGFQWQGRSALRLFIRNATGGAISDPTGLRLNVSIFSHGGSVT